MARHETKLNKEVTTFLDTLNHPFRKEIELLRSIILSASIQLEENIKWNGPNYSIGSEDRITMRIMPPKQVQLIFHRGAKKQEQPKQKLINDQSGLLDWKENDRAVASFKTLADIETRKKELMNIITSWIKAST
jgi:hypothetical protein